MKTHFISIGGKIMHQLAIALKHKGHIITGSDDEIYDPSRSTLAQEGLLPDKMGWDANRITTDLDQVILGMHAKTDNPELKAAQTSNIPIYSFPEYITKFSEDKTRVVIAGSHGKTTMTAATMHVLQKCQKDFDYLLGGKVEGFQYFVQLSDAPLIVMEGDEYLSSAIHREPKIHYYKPHIALLSGIAWDHMNVFPTFENYVEQFVKFLELMPHGSKLIYNAEDSEVCKVVAQSRHLHLIPYQTPAFIQEQGKCYLLNGEQKIPLALFGRHNMQNLAGVQKVCEQLGIEQDTFYEAIQDFEGAKDRLDIWMENEDRVVYRDYAHAPSKVEATTKAVKDLYPNRPLVACFELHTYSSLNKDFLPNYQDTLNPADQAVVYFDPHTFDIKKLPVLSKEEVRNAFGRADLLILNSQKELENFVKSKKWQNTNLLMMSSGTFGGTKKEDIVNFVD